MNSNIEVSETLALFFADRWMMIHWTDVVKGGKQHCWKAYCIKGFTKVAAAAG